MEEHCCKNKEKVYCQNGGRGCFEVDGDEADEAGVRFYYDFKAHTPSRTFNFLDIATLVRTRDVQTIKRIL